MLPKNLRIGVAQMQPMPGNVRKNLESVLEYIERARSQGVKLLVLPELCTSGYVLGDRWEYDSFIKEIEQANDQIRLATHGIGVVWGSVKADWNKIGEDGRVRKYNAAFFATNGEWVNNGVMEGWIPKTNLPKYRVFDDARHFYSAANLAREYDSSLEDLLRTFPFKFKNETYKIALTVCEDLWEDEYSTKPSRIYAKQGIDLMIDISCSPWTADKWHARERMLRNRVKETSSPILYVNSVGLQNNVKNLIWFDGDSALVNENGDFVWRARQHEEELYLIDLERFTTPLPERMSTGIEEIHDALIAAMRSFFAPFKCVVIGLSGGIDSAVSAALLTEALGAEKVVAINMPTQFNSNTTRDLARECARNLGIRYEVVPIQSLYEAHLTMLADFGVANPPGLVKENIQARIRGASVQAAIAQTLGGVFVCNGNKTEVALNYFTLYGDGAGAAAFLADLWKGQVYELARHINRQACWDKIPQGIIDVVPSAELSEDQNVDEGKGDPIFFPYHDKLLRAFSEWRWDPTTVLQHLLQGVLEEKLDCVPGTIVKYFKTRNEFASNLEWAWRQYNMEFKRAQVPPVFLTSRRAFGFDRRDTIADAYLTDDYFKLKSAYLDPQLESVME